MCKFCEAMESHRKIGTILKRHDPDLDYRYSVAIVMRSFRKGQRGCRNSGTDYRYRGCGYDLNFCPECGRPLKGPHQTGAIRNAAIGEIEVDQDNNSASVTIGNNFKYEKETENSAIDSPSESQ